MFHVPVYAIRSHLTGVRCAWLQAKKYPLRYRLRFMRRYLRMGRREQSCLLVALSEHPATKLLRWKHFFVATDNDGIPVWSIHRKNDYFADLKKEVGPYV